MDLTLLQAEALAVRDLFFTHAAELFPRDAFDGLRKILEAECKESDALRREEKVKRSLFTYCLMHFESETDVLETLKHLEVWPALLPQHLDA